MLRTPRLGTARLEPELGMQGLGITQQQSELGKWHWGTLFFFIPTCILFPTPNFLTRQGTRPFLTTEFLTRQEGHSFPTTEFPAKMEEYPFLAPALFLQERKSAHSQLRLFKWYEIQVLASQSCIYPAVSENSMATRWCSYEHSSAP